MYKMCKEYIKTLENMHNKKKLAVYDKKRWPFDQWISVCCFKQRHLGTLCRIHVQYVHREISNNSLFSTKFKSNKSFFWGGTFFSNVYASENPKKEYKVQGTDLCNPGKCYDGRGMLDMLVVMIFFLVYSWLKKFSCF